jgi:hypothetical protein
MLPKLATINEDSELADPLLLEAHQAHVIACCFHALVAVCCVKWAFGCFLFRR